MLALRLRIPTSCGAMQESREAQREEANVTANQRDLRLLAILLAVVGFLFLLGKWLDWMNA